MLEANPRQPIESTDLGSDKELEARPVDTSVMTSFVLSAERLCLPGGYVYADNQTITSNELATLFNQSGLMTRVTASELRQADRAYANAGLKYLELGIRSLPGNLVGFGRIYHYGGSGVMCDFAVDPLHQRQGLGRALIAGRLGMAEAAGVSSLYIPYLRDTNPLRNYYFELGFSETAFGEFIRGANPLTEDQLFIAAAANDMA